MSRRTGITLFTGGGGVELGLRHLVDFVGGVEFCPKIAAHASLALGHPVTCADVREVDFKQWKGIDHLHGSPECTRISGANKNAGETPMDTMQAEACLRAVAQTDCRTFSAENVRQWQGTDAFRKLLVGLEALDFRVHWDIYDAADYGVPQHRDRLLLRAWRGSKPLPPIVPTHTSPEKAQADEVQPKLFGEALLPWNGWHGAIADLLPDCPETQLAAWQVRRLKAQYGEEWLSCLLRVNGEGGGVGVEPDSPSPTLTADGCGKHRAVLVGTGGYAGEVEQNPGTHPCGTLATVHGAGAYRAVTTDNGLRIVSLTTRCLARIQSVPDEYPLPTSKTLATRIIGNMVPPLMAEKVLGGFIV